MFGCGVFRKTRQNDQIMPYVLTGQWGDLGHFDKISQDVSRIVFSNDISLHVVYFLRVQTVRLQVLMREY